MKDTKWLNKANEINKEIKELEQFISVASQVWTGRLIAKTQKTIFKSTPYGGLDSVEYNMGTDIKNEVLDVLRRRKQDLLTELNEIRKL